MMRKKLEKLLQNEEQKDKRKLIEIMLVMKVVD